MRLRNLAASIALAMIVMACPPFAWTVDVIFLVAFGLWFLTWDLRRPKGTLQIASAFVLTALLIIFPIIEISHRQMPVIAGTRGDHLVIVGDSISSGIDPRVPAWPVIMQEITGIPTKNLSQPGTTALDGMDMATKVTPDDRVVLVEIGGNDLLSGVPSSEFGRSLEAILSKLAAPGRTVVMFELPLLPHRIAYGQIQRRLAAKYGVWLIPKRYFVRVISGPDATSDGLHLTTIGARRMANLVSLVLSPILRRDS